MDPYLAKLAGRTAAGGSQRGARAAATPPTPPPPSNVVDFRSAATGLPVQIDKQSADIRAAASVILQRMQFLRQAGITFHGMRDLYEILGYKRLLTNRDYRDRYARGGIAGTIVDCRPDATWRGNVDVVEDMDSQIDTPFEKAWARLNKKHQVQAKLHRADKLSQLSTYSVLLIGAPDGNLFDPLPKGNGTPDKLLFLSAFSGGGGPGGDANSRTVALDADCTIFEFETDTKSPRFALPKSYQLKRTDISSPTLARPVHWSRIVHVAENCLWDEVYGRPALERVWNLLDDLDKVTGGGAEAFWLRANQGLHVNVDKDVQFSSDKSREQQMAELKQQIEDYAHQQARMIRSRGVDITPLGSDVANFESPAEAVLTQIAGSVRIPKRILVGSEAGEMASTQDRDNWEDQIVGRQLQHAGPYIVRRLVDRLLEYNYLPPPSKGIDEYDVRWPGAQRLSEEEKYKGCKAWAEVNASMKNAGLEPVFLGAEMRKKWYMYDPITKEQIEKERLEQPEPVAPLPGKPQMVPRAAEEAELLQVLTAAIEEQNTEVIDSILGLGRTLQDHKFGSTQIQLPATLADRIKAFGRQIPELDLAADGREEDIHVTVKYGLDPRITPEQVDMVTMGSGPVTLVLGPLGVFESEQYDVLFVEAKSPELVKLNEKISSELKVTDTHTVYRPHVTIAYLQPGKGKEYEGQTLFAGETVQAEELVFSSAKDERTVLRLVEPALA